MRFILQQVEAVGITMAVPEMHIEGVPVSEHALAHGKGGQNSRQSAAGMMGNKHDTNVHHRAGAGTQGGDDAFWKAGSK